MVMLTVGNRWLSEPDTTMLKPERTMATHGEHADAVWLRGGGTEYGGVRPQEGCDERTTTAELPLLPGRAPGRRARVRWFGTSFPGAGMWAWLDGEVLDEEVLAQHVMWAWLDGEVLDDEEVVAQHVGEVMDGDGGGVLIFG